MIKTSSMAIYGMLAATAAIADEFDEYDYYIAATPYVGESFDIDITCAKDALYDYVDMPTRTNDDIGILYAGNDNIDAFVAISDKRTEENTATVFWLEVSSANTQSHVNFNRATGSFTNAAYNEGAQIEGAKDVFSLERVMRQCAANLRAVIK